MPDEFVTGMKRKEFEEIINEAFSKAINKILSGKQDKLFTVEEAAKYLNISTVTLWRKHNEGKIESIRSGRLNLYTKAALDNFLTKNKKEVSNG